MPPSASVADDHDLDVIAVHPSDGAHQLAPVAVADPVVPLQGAGDAEDDVIR
jgi:hypothetical protein